MLYVSCYILMINKILKCDWVLLVCTALLVGVSLAVLYSISTSGGADTQVSGIFTKQCLYVVIGLIAMLFFALTNYQYLKSYSTPLYFVTLLILTLVVIFGRTVRGHTGWIGIGSIQIQPVEVTKLTLIIFLASFISQKKMELGEAGRIFVSLILTGFVILLVMMQRDLGSAMVLVSIWLGMTFVSGVSGKKILIIGIIGLAVASASWFHLQQYQKDRVLNLINPSPEDARGSGYNVIQATIAVGSGGLLGKGIGHGSQVQLNFLPEKHTDFMFASVAEELGLVGSLSVISLFSLILYRMKMIADTAPDNFGYLITVGVMCMLFVQVMVNIGRNIGIMPVTGIPLPLLSYGGSSLITVFASLGIVFNIHSKKEKLLQSED